MTSLDQVNRQIANLNAKLKPLYAKKKLLLLQHKKKHTRPTSEEQSAKAFALAKTKTIEQIVQQMKLSKSTIQWYICRKMTDISYELLLQAGKATVERPNQYGGETWEVDHHDLQLERLKINKTLVGRLSPVKCMQFTREHMKTCPQCQSALLEVAKQKEDQNAHR